VEENMQEVKAVAKYVRISPYKVRRVARLIQGVNYAKAEALLKALPHRGSALILKVIKSAVSNAVNNNKYDINSIVIKSVIIDEGPRLKRFKAQARGRIFKIIKRTSHIKVSVVSLEDK